ncbi:MAG TPA: GNAT family N-acetyltransferase [Steroidobacteraceae bacterium]|nr:GNAT family N-acetyltransferase [Steroidobacteraceae bacterium]
MTEPAIRPIRPADDPALAAIIRGVMKSFVADGAGSSFHDAEVDAMCANYSQSRAAYFVVEDGGRVLGGGGIGPLAGAGAHVCELRKMYFLPELRGRGIGARLLQECLAAARERGYQRCYLETRAGMEAAQKLYQRTGFKPICQSLGATGHTACDRLYLLEL